ncbi:replication-relaxation family protein [Streptomyces sp. BPPL-273]|uniref:replication-relaxation family protein n=1 Tax=Streptomyces sp. BPPL-273 TaxID=2987533 RepID=UPI0024AEDBBA|nr:replication-relaxation family protein [Streptomyces sp. BPPL-273]WHM35085.1 replication-relaxation family protein [Streptomyces sp. BPPL-273]
MTDVDTGSRDRLAVAVLAQYRMATTEQMHLILSPDVRIEQTRRRLAKLRGEGLIDRVTLPQAGRTRVWYTTRYGAQVASEWPELRGRRPPRGAHDRTAVRLGVGHGLTVTQTALAFLQDARRHGDLCQPLDWIPEVHHPLGGREAVIPDALLYYRSHDTGRADGSEEGGAMLRAFVEVDRATMGPERLAAKLGAYARLHAYVPAPPPGTRPRLAVQEASWRRHYPLFPRLLFILDCTGPAGIHTRLKALEAAARQPAHTPLLRDVPVLAAPMPDLLQHGPAAPIWHPINGTDQRVAWTHTRHP